MPIVKRSSESEHLKCANIAHSIILVSNGKLIRKSSVRYFKRFKMNEKDIVTHLPDNILETIFSYLDLRDLRNCSLVCKNWYRYLNDENNDVWRMHCIRKLAEDAIKSDLLCSVPTYKAKLRALFHAWNPNDCSRNVYIKSSGFTLHR